MLEKVHKNPGKGGQHSIGFKNNMVNTVGSFKGLVAYFGDPAHIYTAPHLGRLQAARQLPAVWRLSGNGGFYASNI